MSEYLPPTPHHSGSATFAGDLLEEWIKFFGLAPSRDKIMGSDSTCLGCHALADLDEVYKCEDVLMLAKEMMGSIQFREFVLAASRTEIFRGKPWAAPGALEHYLNSPVSVPISPPLPPAATPVPSAPCHLEAVDVKEVSKVREDSRELELERLNMELKAKLEAAEERMSIAYTERRKKEQAYKRTRKIEKRNAKIGSLMKQITKACSLDLVFLLDCTGSMSAYIGAMKNNIIKLVETVKKTCADMNMRIAFVGYRDHGDGSNRLSVLRFTTNINAFVDFVGGQKATGGDDGPEDVMGAINIAEDMDWSSKTRIIYHIGDAPCHGKQYHDLPRDNYPDGDPHNLTPEKLLPVLHQKQVM
jgi:hypothetical protein